MRPLICALIGASLLGAGLAEANDRAALAKRLREWRGIVPGKSTVAEVDKILGKPAWFGEVEGMGLEAHHQRDYDRPDGEPLVSVDFRDGKVLIVTLVPSEVGLPKAERTRAFYMKAFGKPKEWQRSWYGPEFYHWAWPELGLAIVVNWRSGQVVARTLFAPTTAKAYRKTICPEPTLFIR